MAQRFVNLLCSLVLTSFYASNALAFGSTPPKPNPPISFDLGTIVGGYSLETGNTACPNQLSVTGNSGASVTAVTIADADADNATLWTLSYLNQGPILITGPGPFTSYYLDTYVISVPQIVQVESGSFLSTSQEVTTFGFPNGMSQISIQTNAYVFGSCLYQRSP